MKQFVPSWGFLKNHTLDGSSPQLSIPTLHSHTPFCFVGTLPEFIFAKDPAASLIRREYLSRIGRKFKAGTKHAGFAFDTVRKAVDENPRRGIRIQLLGNTFHSRSMKTSKNKIAFFLSAYHMSDHITDNS